MSRLVSFLLLGRAQVRLLRETSLFFHLLRIPSASSQVFLDVVFMNFLSTFAFEGYA